jgi:hypothetical protein
LDVVAGLYSLKACDENACCAVQNITITTTAPIQVSIIGYNGVCQQSQMSTVILNVTGGTPPYRTLQNLTLFDNNNTVSVEFAQQFNNTLVFHIIDSSDCILPVAVSFKIPDPGPVNLTIVSTDSCSTVATGSVVITSTELISCEYFASGIQLPTLQTCTLTNLPQGTFLTVVAQTILGCQATASITIMQRPPIVIIQESRGFQSIFDGACIDNITVSVTGGEIGPPYSVILFQDTSNASIVNDPFNNHTFVVLNVCRSVEYTIIATEEDHTCSTIFVSSDPQFSLGGSEGGNIILGLSPPNNALFLPMLLTPKIDRSTTADSIALVSVTVMFMFVIVPLTIFMLTINHCSKRGIARRKKELKPSVA